MIVLHDFSIRSFESTIDTWILQDFRKMNIFETTIKSYLMFSHL